ncbi:MAG: PTS transporter subunit EIIA [Chloroflexaceae bacterium]|nr:PTS transporter subunit EIIA [Chloroflexaceae bacterium]
MRTLFAFGAIDHTSHIDVLSELAQLLGDEASRECIAAAATPADVVHIIGDYASQQGKA